MLAGRSAIFQIWLRHLGKGKNWEQQTCARRCLVIGFDSQSRFAEIIAAIESRKFNLNKILWRWMVEIISYRLRQAHSWAIPAPKKLKTIN